MNYIIAVQLTLLADAWIYRKVLHSYPALVLDCANPERDGVNTLIGENYFHAALTNEGSIQSFDQITIAFWARFIAESPVLVIYIDQKGGKQIFIQLVDGPTSSPYIDLKLFLGSRNGQIAFFVQNQEEAALLETVLIVENKISVMDFQLFWCHLVFSLDQTSGTPFVNMKFYDTRASFTHLLQTQLFNKKFQFKVSEQTRITNERLTGQDSDMRMCGFMANLEYYNGWSTMDTEPYVDYNSQLVFYLKPFQNTLQNLSPLDIPLKSNIGVQYSGSIGLKLYQNTQLVFVYEEKLDSFTIAFWMKPKTKKRMQLVSFSYDHMLETTLGLGVNKNKLILYQSYEIDEDAVTVQEEQWNHVIFVVLQVSRENDFTPNSDLKISKFFVNGQETNGPQIKFMKLYQRIVIGQLFRDRMDDNIVDLQEVKIFRGAGVMKSPFKTCRYQIGMELPYCLFCEGTSSHSCQENQHPSDDSKFYLCPQGYLYKVSNRVCEALQVTNCWRATSHSSCDICADGFTRNSSGQCIRSESVLVAKQKCASQALVCSVRTRGGMMEVEDLICYPGNKYQNGKCQTTGNLMQGCSQEGQDGCYQCTGTYKLKKNKCVEDCTPCLSECRQNQICDDKCTQDIVVTGGELRRDLRFNNGNTCVATCPKFYSYRFNCLRKLYVGTCVESCPSNGMELIGTCASSSNIQTPKLPTSQYATRSCFLKDIRQLAYVLTQWVLDCSPDCQYCYHSEKSNCLSCREGFILDRLTSTCVKSCRLGSLLPFTNRVLNICETNCPADLYQEGFNCISQCPENFLIYGRTCTQTAPAGTYILGREINECPQLCASCHLSSQSSLIVECDSCIGSYPLYNSICVPTCLDDWHDNETNSCVQECPSDYLTYENSNLNGFAFKECFKQSCGTVVANDFFQTVAHQNDPKRCMQPCEQGFYADYEFLICKPCTDQCRECINQSNYCLSCIEDHFLFESSCFLLCENKFADFLQHKCVGSCPRGYTIQDFENNKQACVEFCGDQPEYAAYIYSYKMYCYREPPSPYVYCDENKYCSDCDLSCRTCNGITENNCTSCLNLFLQGTRCVTTCSSPNNIKDSINWTCVDRCPIETKVYNDLCLQYCPVNTFDYISPTAQPGSRQRHCFDTQPARTFALQRLQGFFFCQPCHASCQVCSGARNSQCSKCSPNFYLLGTTCSSMCPNNLFLNTRDWTCDSGCPSNYFLELNKCVASCSPGILRFQNFCLIGGCPPGYFKQGETCVLCNERCLVCTSGAPNSCSSCKANYFLMESTCGSTCPPTHQFHDETLWLCTPECSFETFYEKRGDKVYCVKSCPQVYYSQVCFTNCPIETYQSGKSCLPCAPICLKCQGPNSNQCQACDDGFFLNGSTCVSKCPPEVGYGDLVSGNCLETCPQFTYERMQICFGQCPFYLYIYELEGVKECVLDCYVGSFIQGQECRTCFSTCVQCYGSLENECIKCAAGYYLNENSCVTNCSLYQDEVNQVCRTFCPTNLFVNEFKCVLACEEQQFIYKQTCTNQCPNRTYIVDQTCYDCPPECASCISQNVCDSCVENYFLEDGRCSEQCSEGKSYNFVDWMCEEFCPTHLFFHLSERRCLNYCNPPMFKNELNIPMCLHKCFSGEYGDLDYTCKLCDRSCETCVSQSSCQSCNDGYYLNLDKCVVLCDPTLFMDKPNNRCQSKCPGGNYHYQIDWGTYIFGFCLHSCTRTSKALNFNNFCLSQCPEGMWADASSNCRSCPFECFACTNDSECTSCIDGYYLSHGKCGVSCGSQFLRITENLCVEECSLAEYVFDNQCVLNCPTLPFRYHADIGGAKVCVQNCLPGTYIDEQFCRPCHPACQQCNGPAQTDCLGCATNFFQIHQGCESECPIGLLKDIVFMVCTQTCKSYLYLDGDTCKWSCPLLSYKNSCLSDCPQKTYLKGNTCLDCNPTCATCDDTECLSCEPDFFLYNGICGSSCNSPLLKDTFNLRCVPKCLEPLVLYIDQCLSSCPNGYYLFNQQCVKNCPISSYLSGSLCIQCQERCLQCISPISCIKCDLKYFDYEGTCLISCPISKPFHDEINWQCQASCPPGSKVLGTKCVPFCPELIDQNACVSRCADGYYANEFKICSPCKSECRSCVAYETCNSCKPNFFLYERSCQNFCPNIMDTTKWECTDSCDALYYDMVCSSICPLQTKQFLNTCVVRCPIGYYERFSDCAQCPRECKACTSNSKCQDCSIGYFFKDETCSASCPEGFVGNVQLRLCVTTCPKKTYQHHGVCQYTCPKGYLHRGQVCTQECLRSQYQDGNKCIDCPIECDGCFGPKNSQCVKCLQGFDQVNGKCVGICSGGYTLISGMCAKCNFKCKTCSGQTSKCLTCRGDRVGEQCKCPTGYFDDQFNENCEKCPCLECIDESKCTKCKNNLQPPLCTCERPNNGEWCTTCDVGRVIIKFKDDLQQIIVDFGYLVLVDILNPFDPSPCSGWFNNHEILGLHSNCYLEWSMTKIIIELSRGASVIPGDKLLFKEQLYKDVNDISCTSFIKQFVDNTVLEPDQFRRPYVEFEVPSLVSSCMEFNITQILINGTALRDQKVLKYSLTNIDDEDHYFEVEYLLSRQGSLITFPMNSLKPSQSYEITAKYINILGKVNQTTFKFTTISPQTPYVYFNKTTFSLFSFIYDCHVTFRDLVSHSQAIIMIQDEMNKTIYRSNHSLLTPFQVSLKNSTLPKGKRLLMIITVERFSYDTILYLPSERIQVTFLQKSRFTSGQSQINARGKNMNLDDQVLQTYQFDYEWKCIDLFQLQPCRSSRNQIVEFPKERVLKLNMEPQNTTYAFYAKAIHAQEWAVGVNLQVIVDSNMEELYVPNLAPPGGSINLNDDVIIILKNVKQFAMIMHDYKLIGMVKIFGNSMKFKLAEIQREFLGSDVIIFYLIPGTESIKLQLNQNSATGKVLVTPEEGTVLTDFSIHIEVSDSSSLQFSYYYYFNYEQLKQDYDELRFQYANPIALDTSANSIKTRLPTGVDEKPIYILVTSQNNVGVLKYFNCTVKVKREDYGYADLVASISEQNTKETQKPFDLAQISVIVDTLQIEQKQVCLKQCSGVGSCVNDKCLCPPGYYFDDCSGNAEQMKQFQEFQREMIHSIFAHNFSNSQGSKQAAKSLLYLMQYNIIWEEFKQEQAASLLTDFSNNLEEKFNKINQLGINLEYQQNSQFKHDQLDLNQIIEPEEIKMKVQTMDLVWSYLLKKKNAEEIQPYEISYKLRKTLEDSVELTFETLLLDTSLDMSGIGAKIILNRTKDANLLHEGAKKRFLQTNASATFPIYYDVVQQIFVRNLYALDGYFPYPEQEYPLYDYKIRLLRRKANIQIQKPINYSFPIAKPLNYKCIMRNQTTYYWSKSNCQTIIKTSQVVCSCTALGPTTLVDDYDFYFDELGTFRLRLPNLIPFLMLGQSGLCLLLLVLAIKKDREPISTNETRMTEKYGHVRTINRRPRMFSSIKFRGTQPNLQDSENSQSQITFEDTNPNQTSMDDINQERRSLIKVARTKKFSVEYIKYHHFILNVIYKSKILLPRWVRAVLILMRIHTQIFLGGVYPWLGLDYQISVFPMIGSLLVLRALEGQLKDAYQGFQFKDNFAGKLFIIFTVVLILAVSTFGLLLLWKEIRDQTNWIMCYLIALGIDLLFMDAVLVVINGFLGQQSKKALQKKIKKIKSIQNMKKVQMSQSQ